MDRGCGFSPDSDSCVFPSLAITQRKLLMSVGTCFGKFTKTLKFRLHITALDYISQYAKYKVWVKPSSELSFLYGNNVLKAGLGRITENTPQYQGVIVYSMSDVPLGFGVTAKTTQECRKLAATDVVLYHQSDVGEYLREEDTLYAGGQGAQAQGTGTHSEVRASSGDTLGVCVCVHKEGYQVCVRVAIERVHHPYLFSPFLPGSLTSAPRCDPCTRPTRSVGLAPHWLQRRLGTD